MTVMGRVSAEFTMAWRSFLRRRTAVFFTFFFPIILILIFGALVSTQPTGGGLFTKPPGYYIAGYLAIVVLFTPLSRVGSTVARHRDGNRFEKLATTPLNRAEWLAAQTLVNVAIIGIAALLILALLLITGATIPLSAGLLLLIPFIALGVVTFCGIGAILGSLTGSQDGVIAASNTIALPLLFLSETFVSPALLPAWFQPVIDLSPLTYFSRGVRAVTYPPAASSWSLDLVVLCALAVVFFALGAYALPQTD